jgi:hypothetical protein
MIKRDINETTYEYDKEGKLLKKTVVTTHEEEDNVVTTNYPWTYVNGYNDITTSTSSDTVKLSTSDTITAACSCGDNCKCHS